MTVKEITKIRTKLGVSQKTIALLLKKHPTFMSKLEAGGRILTPELKKSIEGAFKKIRAAEKKISKPRIKIGKAAK